MRAGGAPDSAIDERSGRALALRVRGVGSTISAVFSGISTFELRMRLF
jgi:hypothetical protein